MGNRLSPITEKVVESGKSQDGKLSYAACGMVGRRSQMEDEHLLVPNLFPDDPDGKLQGHSLFAVFDGHGGASAASFAARNLAGALLAHKSMEKYIDMMRNPIYNDQDGSTVAAKKANNAMKSTKKALLKEMFEESFIQIDRDFLKAQQEGQRRKIDESSSLLGGEVKRSMNFSFKDPGTTALAVLITPDFIVCANAGDCRSFLIQENVESKTTLQSNTSNIVELSEDHRPSNKLEEKRIKNAGGFVFGGRLEEDLAVSRGFGDYRFKEEHITIHGICEEGVRTPGEQKVSPIPEMKFHARKAKHSYLFLGCDGVFEVMKTEKVAKTLSRSLASHKTDLEAAIVHLLDKSLRKGSKDNMTAVLVKFD